MSNFQKTILYYHLYFEKNAISIITKHLEIIEKGGFDLVFISAYNVNFSNEVDFKEIRTRVSVMANVNMHVSSRGDINEFATLEKIYDGVSSYKDSDWVAYAHSKGISHGSMSNASLKGELLLRQLMLIHSVVKNNEVFADYFDVAGSDLVAANFNDFGPPQCAFAGNMWIAKASHISKLIKIHSNMKYMYSLRYHAEAWIGSHYSSHIFNIFSPARHHYDEHWRDVDELKIASELKHFIMYQPNYNEIQKYFNSVISYNCNKIEGLYVNFYPHSLKARRLFNKFIYNNVIRNKMLYRIVMSICYRSGLLKSPLGLFYLDVPSHLTLSKGIK